MNTDALGFRTLFFILLAALSVTFRGFEIGSSSFHSSLLYLDLPVIGALLFVYFLLWLVQGRSPSVRNVPTFLPLVLLTVWWAVSGLVFAKKGDLFAASALQAFAGMAAALFLPAILGRYGLLTRVLDMFLKISIAVAAVAVFQVLVEPSRLFTSVTSTLGPNRSHLGLYMLTAFAVAIFRLYQGGGRLAVFAASASILAILISGSRASQIGCFLVFLPYMLSRFSAKNALRFAVGACVVGAVIVYIGNQRQGEKAEMQFEVSEDVKVDKSAGRRLLIWVATWDLITRNPQNLLLGVGFTNYRWEYDRTIKLPFYTNAAHNTFLQVWSETGLVGLLLFLASLGGIFVHAVSLRRRRPECLALAGLVAGLAFTGFTQETLYPIEAYCNFNTLFFLAAGTMLYPEPGRGSPRDGEGAGRQGQALEAYA